MIDLYISISASSDESVWVYVDRTSEEAGQGKVPGPIKHPVAVRAILPLSLTELAEPYLLTAAGDVLRTFDVSSLAEPELMSEIDGHWHDITAIRLWIRKFVNQDDKTTRIEPWIVTTGLDRTIRKWKLDGKVTLCIELGKVLKISATDLLHPPPPVAPKEVPEIPAPGMLTEEEERELAELMAEQ